MNIYIGNLDFQVDEIEIIKMFALYGDVETVKLIRDKDTGRSKGYGFIEMPKEEDALRAISNLNESEVMGRPIKVNNASENASQENQGQGPQRRPYDQGRSNGPRRNDRFDSRPPRPYDNRNDRSRGGYSNNRNEQRPPRSFDPNDENRFNRAEFNQDRHRVERPYSDRPRTDRPFNNDRPRTDRPYNDRPRTDRPYSSDRPRTDRPYNSDRPRTDRPYNDRQRTDRPYGDSNRTDRPYNSDRPPFDRNRTDRPRVDRDDRPRFPRREDKED